MGRARGQAQPFGAARYGGIVDWLHIDIMVIKQQLANAARCPGIPHHHRHDMGVAFQYRNAGVARLFLEACGLALLRLAFAVTGAQMAYRSAGCSGHRRRDGGGKDKARAVAAHRIANHVTGGNITAGSSERLAKRALNDIDLGIHPAHCGHTGTTSTIHADRMHLVQIGQRIVFFGKRGNLGNRAGIPIH